MNYHNKENPLAEIIDAVRENDKSEEIVLCRSCFVPITEKREITEIDGSAFHYKKNPAGIYFRIVCFRSAKGCRNVGFYTSEYSWFPGYKWCIVICGACSSHLGWQYSGAGNFYGLIADRITGF